ncbi:MAG: hypothetical protein JSW11_12285 [Candidatus Heimdallarchaeota archaeon]|nr:MAG: hypothetical protein JSW11_12285 [Candidatus Heimdallarchaeota archaeon]
MSPSKRPYRRKDTKTDVRDLPTPPSVFNHPPSPPSDLPPPLSESQDILSRPPLPESPAKPSLQEPDSLIIEDNITSDILKELRRGDFGSLLQHVPVKRPLTLDEIEGPRFLAAKDAYLAAGKKHLELNFYENAAMNYSCAILSMYLGKDVFTAAHLMSELALVLPPSIVNSYFFQGARLLLKGILLKNASSIAQAENWLLKEIDHLYNEDIDLIRRALRQAETNF